MKRVWISVVFAFTTAAPFVVNPHRESGLHAKAEAEIRAALGAEPTAGKGGKGGKGAKSFGGSMVSKQEMVEQMQQQVRFPQNYQLPQQAGYTGFYGAGVSQNLPTGTGLGNIQQRVSPWGGGVVVNQMSDPTQPTAPSSPTYPPLSAWAPPTGQTPSVTTPFTLSKAAPVPMGSAAVGKDAPTRPCALGQTRISGECVTTWDFDAHLAIKPSMGAMREISLEHKTELSELSRLMALMPEEIWKDESECCLGKVPGRQRMILQYPKDEGDLTAGVVRYPSYEYLKDLLQPIMRDVILQYQYPSKDIFINRIVLEKTPKRMVHNKVESEQEIMMGTASEGHTFRVPIITNNNMFFVQRLSPQLHELIVEQNPIVAERKYEDGLLKTRLNYGYAYEVDVSHLSFSSMNYGVQPCVTLIFELFANKDALGYKLEKEVGLEKESWYSDVETQTNKKWKWDSLRKQAQSKTQASS